VTRLEELLLKFQDGSASPEELRELSGLLETREARAALVDDTSLTKWLTFANTATITDQLTASVAVKQYTLTSANDFPTRDPRDWTLQGSNDGTTWTTVDTRANVDFADRRQTRPFAVTGSASYSRYRLVVSANHGAAETQLAELQLLAALLVSSRLILPSSTKHFGNLVSILIARNGEQSQ